MSVYYNPKTNAIAEIDIESCLYYSIITIITYEEIYLESKFYSGYRIIVPIYLDINDYMFGYEYIGELNEFS